MPNFRTEWNSALRSRTSEASVRTDSWNLPAPPGFRGLDPELPVTQYQRHLPHWRQDGATYFVTFRLADSLPQSKLNELRGIREEWGRRHPPPRSSADWDWIAKETMTRTEKWLDEGFGSCGLGEPGRAELVAEAMQRFDGDRYQLFSHVVMPNHAHLLVKPLQPHHDPLEKILQSWKAWTARETHCRWGGEGQVWQDESYDRIVRDEEHLYRCVQYIGRNPAKAGRSRERCCCWIRPEWIAAGWKFEPERPVGPLSP
jgi:putative transposase